jgi:hypothetical protein
MPWAMIIGFCFALFNSTSSARAALQCPVGLDFPIDFMVCNDAQLAALENELDAVQQLAEKKQASLKGGE